MILRNRNELKSFFKNNRVLSEKYFAELIDSMLNKQEDKFHGLWRPGQTYRKGDVVIYNGTLWVMNAESEVCSTKEAQHPGAEGNSNWKLFVVSGVDGDWKVLPDEGVMWAEVFGKVGIGVGNEEGERPQARLDVYKSGQGRWLLFPENAGQVQFNLLNTGFANDNSSAANNQSYLVTGLSLEEVTWLSDASNGFVFRWRSQQSVASEVNQRDCADDLINLNPADGQVLMVIKPKTVWGNSEVATLGMNVDHPAAILDITDRSRGQLLFTPHQKEDPTLVIGNFDANNQPKNYLAIGVGHGETSFVSDTPAGFVFRQGGEYGGYCQDKDANQGELLMVIRQHSEQSHPQVGIGTAHPQACLDVKDNGHAQVHVLPERSTETKQAPDPEATLPVITILDLLPSHQPIYLTGGLQDKVAGWVSNAEQGFVFRQGRAADGDANQPQLEQGKTHLSIREDGRVGIGTEDPYTRLDIVNESRTGKFLFNLDQKVNPALGILNLSPGSKANYLTVGADNNHGILVTDSPYGFLFKFGAEFDTNDSQIDINQGDTLVSIRPEGKGRMGIGKQPIDYELDINGMVRGFTFYQDTNSEKICNSKSLNNVLDRVKNLRPITFEWNSGTGFQNMGEQIGLLAHEVDDVFPQVVKTSDGNPAIAYQNMVPVLIQAIKELICEKDQAQEELETLRNEFNVYQQNIEERLRQLTDRIETM